MSDEDQWLERAMIDDCISPMMMAEVRSRLATLRAAVERLTAERDAALEDSRRLDWMADARIFDGIGDIDIDEATLEAVCNTDGSEEEWRIEWRKQMRAAIDAARGV